MNIVCNYATFIMFFLNVYLYIWNPLEKHYDLIKIVFGWVIALFVFNYGTDIHIYTGNPSVLGGISF